MTFPASAILRKRRSKSINRRHLLTTALAAATASILTPIRSSAEDNTLSPLDKNLYVQDEVDHAVEKGLAFLLANQKEDGRITDRNHPIAMTALSIMAMASIGTTPMDPTPRGKTMNKALEYVLSDQNQNAEGYFGDQDGSRMYGHGIITLMLTEMLGMGASPQQNQKIHNSLVDALQVILASQAISKSRELKGGWRYTPSSRDSDLSVSVWQLMALRSAKNDELNVPAEAIDLAVRYLQYSYTTRPDRDGNLPKQPAGFSYTPGSGHPTFTMTSAGLLALQVCGKYDSPMVSGAAEWLLQHPAKINERFFFYGTYYYAQGMHQVGGKYADAAAQRVRDTLLKAQRGDGSWQSQSSEEKNVGRVYATSLAILSLSVRYHYLPIYQR